MDCTNKKEIRVVYGDYTLGVHGEGYDYIFIARNTIVDKKCADVKKSLESACRKAGIYKNRR